MLLRAEQLLILERMLVSEFVLANPAREDAGIHRERLRRQMRADDVAYVFWLPYGADAARFDDLAPRLRAPKQVKRAKA